MTDRNVQFPNRFEIVPVPGTTNIFDVLPAPGTVYAEGTFWNKQNVLKDATAALYGKGSNASPDEIFAAARALITAAQNTANAKPRIETGNYTGDGTVPKTLTFSFPPKVVFISHDGSSSSSTALINGMSIGASIIFAGARYLELVWSGNSVTYRGADLKAGLNESGGRYYYFAIG